MALVANYGSSDEEEDLRDRDEGYERSVVRGDRRANVDVDGNVERAKDVESDDEWKNLTSDDDDDDAGGHGSLDVLEDGTDGNSTAISV